MLGDNRRLLARETNQQDFNGKRSSYFGLDDVCVKKQKLDTDMNAKSQALQCNVHGNNNTLPYESSRDKNNPQTAIENGTYRNVDTVNNGINTTSASIIKHTNVAPFLNDWEQDDDDFWGSQKLIIDFDACERQERESHGSTANMTQPVYKETERRYVQQTTETTNCSLSTNNSSNSAKHGLNCTEKQLRDLQPQTVNEQDTNKTLNKLISKEDFVSAVSEVEKALEELFDQSENWTVTSSGSKDTNSTVMSHKDTGRNEFVSGERSHSASVNLFCRLERALTCEFEEDDDLDISANSADSSEVSDNREQTTDPIPEPHSEKTLSEATADSSGIPEPHNDESQSKATTDSSTERTIREHNEGSNSNDKKIRKKRKRVPNNKTTRNLYGSAGPCSNVVIGNSTDYKRHYGFSTQQGTTFMQPRNVATCDSSHALIDARNNMKLQNQTLHAGQNQMTNNWHPNVHPHMQHRYMQPNVQPHMQTYGQSHVQPHTLSHMQPHAQSHMQHNMPHSMQYPNINWVPNMLMNRPTSQNMQSQVSPVQNGQVSAQRFNTGQVQNAQMFSLPPTSNSSAYNKNYYQLNNSLQPNQHPTTSQLLRSPEDQCSRSTEGYLRSPTEKAESYTHRPINGPEIGGSAQSTVTSQGQQMMSPPLPEKTSPELNIIIEELSIRQIVQLGQSKNFQYALVQAISPGRPFRVDLIAYMVDGLKYPALPKLQAVRILQSPPNWQHVNILLANCPLLSRGEEVGTYVLKALTTQDMQRLREEANKEAGLYTRAVMQNYKYRGQPKPRQISPHRNVGQSAVYGHNGTSSVRDNNIPSHSMRQTAGNSFLGQNVPAAGANMGQNGPTVPVGQNGSNMAMGQNGPNGAMGHNGPSITMGQNGPNGAMGQHGANVAIGQNRPTIAMGQNGPNVAIGQNRSANFHNNPQEAYSNSCNVQAMSSGKQMNSYANMNPLQSMQNSLHNLALTQQQQQQQQKAQQQPYYTQQQIQQQQQEYWKRKEYEQQHLQQLIQKQQQLYLLQQQERKRRQPMQQEHQQQQPQQQQQLQPQQQQQHQQQAKKRRIETSPTDAFVSPPPVRGMAANERSSLIGQEQEEEEDDLIVVNYSPAKKMRTPIEIKPETDNIDDWIRLPNNQSTEQEHRSFESSTRTPAANEITAFGDDEGPMEDVDENSFINIPSHLLNMSVSTPKTRSENVPYRDENLIDVPAFREEVDLQISIPCSGNNVGRPRAEMGRNNDAVFAFHDETFEENEGEYIDLNDCPVEARDTNASYLSTTEYMGGEPNTLSVSEEASINLTESDEVEQKVTSETNTGDNTSGIQDITSGIQENISDMQESTNLNDSTDTLRYVPMPAFREEVDLNDCPVTERDTNASYLGTTEYMGDKPNTPCVCEEARIDLTESNEVEQNITSETNTEEQDNTSGIHENISDMQETTNLNDSTDTLRYVPICEYISDSEEENDCENEPENAVCSVEITPQNGDNFNPSIDNNTPLDPPSALDNISECDSYTPGQYEVTVNIVNEIDDDSNRKEGTDVPDVYTKMRAHLVSERRSTREDEITESDSDDDVICLGEEPPPAQVTPSDTSSGFSSYDCARVANQIDTVIGTANTSSNDYAAENQGQRSDSGVDLLLKKSATEFVNEYEVQCAQSLTHSNTESELSNRETPVNVPAFGTSQGFDITDFDDTTAEPPQGKKATVMEQNTTVCPSAENRISTDTRSECDSGIAESADRSSYYSGYHSDSNTIIRSPNGKFVPRSVSPYKNERSILDRDANGHSKRRNQTVSHAEANMPSEIESNTHCVAWKEIALCQLNNDELWNELLRRRRFHECSKCEIYFTDDKLLEVHRNLHA